MAKTTAALVQKEGNFFKEQFPLSSTTARTQEQFDALMLERVNQAAAELKLLVGATNYADTDVDITAALTTAETYLATAKVYNTMLNIIAAWDAEVLPSEFVESDVCERQRDWYMSGYGSIAGPFQVQSKGTGTVPYLVAVGADVEVEA